MDPFWPKSVKKIMDQHWTKKEIKSKLKGRPHRFIEMLKTVDGFA
jgi:hypothetical protein